MVTLTMESLRNFFLICGASAVVLTGVIMGIEWAVKRMTYKVKRKKAEEWMRKLREQYPDNPLF